MADDALKGETIEQCDTGSEITTGDGTKAFSRDAKLECVASLYGQYPLWMIQQESKLASYGMIAKWGSNYPHLDPAFRRRLQTKDNTGALRLWLLRHKKNPYPSKPEKIMLAILSRMTMTQVSTWFANARRRLKKEFPESGAELYTTSTDISKDESSTDFCQTVFAGQQ